MDFIISLLLKQNLTGWRAQALMLKQASETGLSYLAAQPDTVSAVKGLPPTALLDVFTASFHELALRSSKDSELYPLIARWMCKEADPTNALRKLLQEVQTHSSKGIKE